MKEYSKGVYVKFKPEEVELLHDRMKEAGVQNMSAYIRKMALSGYVIFPEWPGYIPAHCLPICKTRNEGENKTMENVTFDYKFYRIPKRFFKEDMFRDMTNAAKVLYGILLDRKCLSDSNGDAWRDEYGITYIIFTIEEIMNLMNLGNKKVNKMFKELEEHGLIYRRHQGLGRPNKIYFYDLLKADNSNWLPKQIMFGKGSSNEKEVL